MRPNKPLNKITNNNNFKNLSRWQVDTSSLRDENELFCVKRHQDHNLIIHRLFLKIWKSGNPQGQLG